MDKRVAQNPFLSKTGADVLPVCFSGRLFVIAPLTKSKDGPEPEQTANAFAQQIGRTIEYDTDLKARLVLYDSATVKEAIVYDPEYASVEINFDPDQHKQPQVYINGELY